MSEENTFSDLDQAGTQAGGAVVLMREGSDRCAVLLRALSARGLSPVVVHDEPSAMVALAGLAQRDVGRCVLVVVEPSQWGRVDQLADAVRAHHGSVCRWQFDLRDEARPMLSPLDAASDEVSVVGKIRKRTRTIDQLLVPAPGRELSTREVVTQQELTMLLGPAPGEAG